MLTLAVPGLFATVALPAYAITPGAPADQAPAALSAAPEIQAQQLRVETTAAAGGTRDAFTATSMEELERARRAAERERIAEQRRAAAAAVKSYSGPSASDLLAAPPYPNFSLDQVVSVARQYIGTPYVYGGSSPSGFDCSGFIMYVYAQFGVSLPHSVTGQARAGTRISREDARPGDLVIFNDGSHNGFWMGDGMILDAPRRGKSVSIRPLWTDAYYIVRVGI